jgi:hypothetical protein
MRELLFHLPFALKSLNVRDRQHWSVRQREKQHLAQEVMAAIGGPRHYPRPPFAAARVTVWRHSAGALDADNLVASCKPLLDVLCAPSQRHPAGLGIVQDDAPDVLQLVVRQSKAPRGKQFTRVWIERLDAGSVAA